MIEAILNMSTSDVNVFTNETSNPLFDKDSLTSSNPEDINKDVKMCDNEDL